MDYYRLLQIIVKNKYSLAKISNIMGDFAQNEKVRLGE